MCEAVAVRTHDAKPLASIFLLLFLLLLQLKLFLSETLIKTLLQFLRASA